VARIISAELTPARTQGASLVHVSLVMDDSASLRTCYPAS
jgi:hypothetical protein